MNLTLEPLYQLGRTFWLLVLAVFIFSFLVTDCVRGDTDYYSGEITGRRYEPAYTTAAYVSSSRRCDSKGKNCSTTTTYHPPVYHPPHWYMVVSSREGVESFEISETEYDNLAMGTKVPLQCQVGYYTGWHYNSNINNHENE